MSKVVRIHEYGGPEQLRTEELDVGNPGPGEVRIRVEAIGLNRSEVFDPVGGPDVDILAQAASEEGVIIIYGGLSGRPTPYPHWPAITPASTPILCSSRTKNFARSIPSRTRQAPARRCIARKSA